MGWMMTSAAKRDTVVGAVKPLLLKGLKDFKFPITLGSFYEE
jgi:hypothetical protein